MGKSLRNRQLKDCEHCAQTESVLYRIRLQQAATWIFICSGCQSKVKSQALYQYGGTWKQQKRH